MQSTQNKKVIFVIGGTGAQGMAVIRSLVQPRDDGSPSPWSVRALTRDTSNARAQQLVTEYGVELVKGSVQDLDLIESSMRDAYGAFVNTDGFTIGEQAELYYGIRIFEIAKQIKTLKHFVWGNLDYALKAGGYDSQYKCDHYDAKGRVAEWIKAQPSATAGGMTWSILTSGPYMDMLYHLFAPLGERPDGTVVFAAPINDGHVPMVVLSDIGYFARYIFDHPGDASGKDFEVASELVGWDYLVATFSRVTGKKAVFLRQSLDEYFDMFHNADRPVARDMAGVGGATTFRKNFSGWWSLWRDDVVKRDMAWIKSINPNTVSLEQWMRREGYTGARKDLLKIAEGRGSLFDDVKLQNLLR